VVARAQRIMAELDALVSDVAAVRNVVKGTVRLGMIGTTARWLAPRMLDEMGRRHPGVHLWVVEGTSAELARRLEGGRLDLAVSSLPSSGDDLSGSALFEEDLVLVVDRASPLAGRQQIEVEELGAIPLLLPMPGTSFRRELEEAMALAGGDFTHLRAKAELDGVRLIASLTFDGHGPAVLPASAVPDYLRDRWVTLPILDLRARIVGVLTRQRGLLSGPARAVLAILRTVIEDQVGGGARPGIRLPAPAPSDQA
jgi:DNA-binding transcriptional LysR family regulator